MTELSKLSKIQKQELLKALTHKQLLQKEKKIDEIVPNKVQEHFFKSLARVRALTAGNATGKTTAIIIELIRTHTRRHPFRDVSTIDHTWFICPSYGKIDDYVDALRKWCPPSEFPTFDKMGTPHIRRLVWKNGSKTTFYSKEQDASALEGTNFDALFIDEPCPRSLFIAARRGLRSNPNHFICMAFTAIDEPWLYTDIYSKWASGEDKTVECFTGTTYDNLDNIDPEWLKEFESSLTEEERKVRILGEFAVLQGRVFKEYRRAIHVVKYKPWPKDWPVYMCVDPHTRKRSTALWLGVTKDDEFIVIDEASDENIEELGKLINQIEKQKEYRVVMRIIDNSGSSRDWTGSTAVDIFREKCDLRFSPVSNAQKDVDESILRIKQLMTPRPTLNGKMLPRFFIMENCVKLASELELYGWKENRHPEKTGESEKVRKVNDDYIDPLRYLVMSDPCYNYACEPISYSRGYRKSTRTELRYKDLFED